MNRNATLRRFPWLVALSTLTVLAVANNVLQPNFLTAAILLSNLTTFLPLALVAVGQTYVVLAGDVDLSVGPMAALVNVAAVTVMARSGIAAGMAAGVLAAMGCGLCNGLLVARLRFQPVVATFGTGIVYGGLALWVLPTAGLAVPDAYWQRYAGEVFGLPLVLWLLAAALVFVLLMQLRPFQHHVLAVGGSRSGAFQSGLRVDLIRMGGYLICALFTSVAALCLTAEAASGDPLTGQSLTLSSVSAVVLGGTALAGGFGGAIGSILGALTLGLIGNVIYFANLPFAWQTLAQGLVVMAALAGGVLVTRR